MRTEAAILAVFVGMGLAACGMDKEPEVGLDYGPEAAPLSAKDDSATSPASMARLTLGTSLKTTFTATGRWRAFKFAATAGSKFDIYVDGLAGLDTVAYVYNVSATTGRPFGRSIASNDDTTDTSWTSNASSSFIRGFKPLYSRDYAVVVTTYQQKGRGTASVVVRGAVSTTAVLPFVTSAAGTSVLLAGTPAQHLTTGSAVNALAAATPTGPYTYVAAYRARPADLAHGALASIVAAAFSDSLDSMSQYVPGPEIATGTADAHLAGSTVEDFLRSVMGADLDGVDAAKVRPNYAQLVASMTHEGSTNGFVVHYDNGDDMSYDGLIIANTATGDIRIVGVRNDP